LAAFFTDWEGSCHDSSSTEAAGGIAADSVERVALVVENATGNVLTILIRLRTKLTNSTWERVGTDSSEGRERSKGLG
jgi:hypothetical protein